MRTTSSPGSTRCQSASRQASEEPFVHRTRTDEHSRDEPAPPTVTSTDAFGTEARRRNPRDADAAVPRANDRPRFRVRERAVLGTKFTSEGPLLRNYRYKNIPFPLNTRHALRAPDERGHETPRRGREYRPRWDGPRPRGVCPLARRRRAGQAEPAARTGRESVRPGPRAIRRRPTDRPRAGVSDRIRRLR